MSSTDLVLVRTTLESAADARDLATRLLEERLIACANIHGTATSLYRWEGELVEEGEAILVMKSSQAVLDRLMVRLAALHPYEVPAIVVLPALAAAPDFEAWVTGEIT